MAVAISEDLADAFAIALIKNAGNKTKAAIDCGYQQGDNARAAGFSLSRNPRVLEKLQPLVSSHLSALTPKAVHTLGKLLEHRSGYIRLEAAKDILNRNGVGTEQRAVSSQPFLIRINLGSTTSSPVLSEDSTSLVPQPQSPDDRPGGRKSEKPEEARTPAHDFSSEVLTGSVIDADEVSKPLSEEKVGSSNYSFELD